MPAVRMNDLRPRLEVMEGRSLMASGVVAPPSVDRPIMTAAIVNESTRYETLSIHVLGQPGATPFEPAKDIVASTIKVDGVRYPSTTLSRDPVDENGDGIADATITFRLPAGTSLPSTVVLTAVNRFGTRAHPVVVVGTAPLATGGAGGSRGTTPYVGTVEIVDNVPNTTNVTVQSVTPAPGTYQLIGYQPRALTGTVPLSYGGAYLFNTANGSGTHAINLSIPYPFFSMNFNNVAYRLSTGGSYVPIYQLNYGVNGNVYSLKLMNP